MQKRRQQTWRIRRISDSPDSQEDENQQKLDLEKPNRNKDLKRHLTLPQSSVIFIK